MIANLTHEQMIAIFPKLLIEYIGENTAEMLHDYHVEKMSYQVIAHKYEVPRVTTHRRMMRARTQLRRLGLMPEEWETRSKRAKQVAGPSW